MINIKKYFIGQILGANAKLKYFALMGTKEYEILGGGLNTVFVIRPVFN